MNTLKKISLTLLFTVGICFTSNTYATEDPPINETPPEFEEDKPQMPIDGGVSALIAAGIAYGAKKYRDYRQNLNQANEQSQ